jgi:hypothetical protein
VEPGLNTVPNERNVWVNNRIIAAALSVFIVTACGLKAEPDCTYALFLQPWTIAEQNDAWYANGFFDIGLHRAAAALRAEHMAGPIGVTGQIRFDMVESYVQNSLQNAWVALSFKPYLKFKAGKFKIPFGASSLISPSRLPTVYESFTAGHMKDKLAVAGYRSGAVIYGDLCKAADFSIGTFQYSLDRVTGAGTSDLYRLPVARLSLHPLPMTSIDYMIAAPQLARYGEWNRISSRRFLLHDIALTVEPNTRYRGFLELFYGIDTSQVKDMQDLWEGYDDNVAYSIYSAHTFTLALPWNLRLRLTTAGEFLNGLNYIYQQFSYRQFYYAATQDVQLVLGKGVVVEMSYDMRVNEQLHGFRQQRIAAQISFFTSGRLGGKGKQGHYEYEDLDD